MINLSLNQTKIELTPILHSIIDIDTSSENEIMISICGNSYDTDRVEEQKILKFNLTIRIDQSIWNIPYLILLTKWHKPTDNPRLYKDNYLDNSDYWCEKKRYINIPFFMLEEYEGINTLIEILLVIDSNSYSVISMPDYENFHSEHFFSSLDIDNISNRDKLEYCIRKYYQVPKSIIVFNRERKNWKIPYINLKNDVFSFEKWIIQKEKSEFSAAVFDIYIIAPKTYTPTYHPEPNDLHYISTDNPKSRNIFYGTYNECKGVFFDEQIFSSLIKKVHGEDSDKAYRAHLRESQRDSDNYFYRGGWKSDYFDAMTDGQQGNYNDFSGDLDDIDRLSRG